MCQSCQVNFPSTNLLHQIKKVGKTEALLLISLGRLLVTKSRITIWAWAKVIIHHFTYKTRSQMREREKERKRENRRERKEFNFISFIFLQYIALLYILPLTEYHGK